MRLVVIGPDARAMKTWEPLYAACNRGQVDQMKQLAIDLVMPSFASVHSNTLSAKVLEAILPSGVVRYAQHKGLYSLSPPASDYPIPRRQLPGGIHLWT
jgi:hypothetical protein